ncbi:DUF4332 domain-containing protein [Candidatus Laterigemmans baculatus]|uniref:DUF4332 domain-containing protein n=1 Tax=Candidatus Laterigemmans baculatus TaxID=2770505 RepID=UPI0013D9EC63|nr:DUF4332 domain-containing protein [Candidatus Laterigemmans baculatus]
MEGLSFILRAAHCRSTHHLFAIDALRHVRSEPGHRLARLLLRYHSRYLSGACDPDTRFRDFQNHVVHVADGNWGGAPQSAQQWYGRLQQLLRDQRYSDAAHAAGVLSHYFTDPLQPLHTGQSDREAIVHRPLEWSIFHSYDTILARWRDDSFRIVFRLSTRSDWLSSAVIRGAELAHQSFETLVETYDLDAGRDDPRKGLSEAALDTLAELCGVAIVGWARVLDRAATEASDHLPVLSLGGSTMLAVLGMPYGWFLRRRQSVWERDQIRAALLHYHRTGDVGPFAPDDVRLLRKVLAVRDRERRFAELRLEQNRSDDRLAAATRLRIVAASGSEDSLEEEPECPSLPRHDQHDTAERYVSEASPLDEAAVVGPQTALQLRSVGIATVRQLLDVSPEELVRRLQQRWPAESRWISVEAISGWQAQTRLRIAMPQIRARDARLLVAAGYRSIGTLAAAKPQELHDKLHRQALTPEGRLALRGGSPPPHHELRAWIRAAASARRAAAA